MKSWLYCLQTYPKPSPDLQPCHLMQPILPPTHSRLKLIIKRTASWKNIPTWTECIHIASTENLKLVDVITSRLGHKTFFQTNCSLFRSVWLNLITRSIVYRSNTLTCRETLFTYLLPFKAFPNTPLSILDKSNNAEPYAKYASPHWSATSPYFSAL